MTEEVEISGEEGVQAGGALPMVERTMERFMASADVGHVYDEPIEHGDLVLIPAAEVVAALGFGAGYGSGPHEEGEAQGVGGGGGGGGRTLSRPVAAIVVSPEGVRVEPVVDVTKIALAALTAAGFMFSMMTKMKRGVS
jgi:uncharacterized spore protein YtfJ